MSDIKLFPPAIRQGLRTSRRRLRPGEAAADADRGQPRHLARHPLPGPTEYSTGKTHAGRIDSLGLDENNCPVILEYKRSVGENVINQGLFYLDWLMDHQAEFKLLVMDQLGKPAADAIDWTAPGWCALRPTSPSTTGMPSSR